MNSAAKIKLNSFDDLLGLNENKAGFEQVQELALSDLHSFKNHPFKVLDDEKMQETVESIREQGILIPGIARPRAEGGYEIIAGHRRKHGCELLGIATMPMFVRNYTDDEATIIMVDSNIQRENIAISEKAKAYRMKYDAMKHQGKHLDSGALAQVGPKFTDGSQLNEKGNNTSTINSNELLARQVGESVAQIKRYIRLTKLIPKILDMVDDGKIAFTIAVELSYLSENEQYELHAVMDLEQCTPSLSHSIKRPIFSPTAPITGPSVNPIRIVTIPILPPNKNAITITVKSNAIRIRRNGTFGIHFAMINAIAS